ncbi:hypothetical protein [Thalassococcus lentus]|uniref:Uncharacterized protein n=1 Tax=Thalassococcus lentus TaxID=1210524 RepID=A0ABT4XP05_9RHOB|nr:hypothetical protein [Thalassococcus lentus]MDA7423682.1 hypothetical protein [Thalassococcus lentus]
MSQIKTEIGEIAYNPALEAFEALVTFHTIAGPQRVASAFRATLNADFDVISDGLLRDALQNFTRSGALRSRVAVAPEKPQHSLSENSQLAA